MSLPGQLFSLDEELLLPGKYTPQLQEALAHLGSKMPFGQAVELNQRTQVEESTLRGTAYQHDQAAEAL